MPTSGDLKSGDCRFFTTPPEIQRLPPRKIDPAPNGNDLGHYMKIYMMYILSKFEIIFLMLEIIVFMTKILNTCKNAPETVLQIRKIQVLS